jgi:hypothetical protein
MCIQITGAWWLVAASLPVLAQTTGGIWGDYDADQKVKAATVAMNASESKDLLCEKSLKTCQVANQTCETTFENYKVKVTKTHLIHLVLTGIGGILGGLLLGQLPTICCGTQAATRNTYTRLGLGAPEPLPGHEHILDIDGRDEQSPEGVLLTNLSKVVSTRVALRKPESRGGVASMFKTLFGDSQNSYSMRANVECVD